MEAERAERARLAEANRLALEARQVLVAAVETGDLDTAPTRVTEARAAWLALEPATGPDVVAVTERFERACANAEAASARLLAQRERCARLEALAAEAEELASQEDPSAARGRWKALTAEWSSIAGVTDVEPEVGHRFEAASARLRERDAALRDQRAREQRENLERLQRLADELGRLAAAPELTLKQASRAVQQARSAMEHPGALPSRRDQEALAAQFKTLLGAVQARAQELREADDWQRWANVTVQEALIRRVEELRETVDLAEAARSLRQAQEEWKKVSAVPKEKSQELWRQFKAASDAVRSRTDAWFAEKREERTANLAKKESLCQRAEALAESTDWLKTAEEVKALQAEWKTVGPGLRDKAVWERFRGACDRFFSRRHADLVHRKEAWAINQQKKEALCARIEALASTTSDWEAALGEVRRMQVEWRAIGPVRRSKSEDLWQRFIHGGERFMERYRQRDQLALQAKVAEREAMCRDLERLAGIEPPVPDATGSRDPEAAMGGEAPGPNIGSAAGAGPSAGANLSEASNLTPAELVARVQALRSRWQHGPALPREQLEPLSARFGDALQALTDRRGRELRGTDLDPDANRRKMEAICSRVEALLVDGVRPETAASPAALLANQLREALAANTIGGRVNEEAKWKAAADEVREAQAAWRRIGPVPGEIGRHLTDRFDRACARFFDQQRRRMPAPQPSRSVAGPTRHG
jgi:hypothetical protein